MPESQPNIPEITDEDIDDVCSLMGLDALDEPRRAFLKHRSTVDVSACPGSGKTTLIVAKLAILAQKWPHRTRGICVLSHTNVAREEIERRLGNTVVGQRLLSYPHFVDTIHGFVNRFLALPWLYSNDYPSPTIDDNVTTAYRRRVLGTKGYWSVHSFLTKKYSGFEKLRICGRDLSFGVGGKPFPAKATSQSFLHAKRAIETTAQAGYFCYDEMFVWADALLEDQVDLPVWLTKRFPLVILDEMQDTFEQQTALLDRVFPRESDALVVQRVGDPNQQIFDLSERASDLPSSYPDLDQARCLSLPNSYRFGPEIAALASPFAVQPVGTDGLCGIGPKRDGVPVEPCGHAVFIFPDTSTDGVLDAYGKHALAVLGSELVTQGPVAAVGHIHQPDVEVRPGHGYYPKTIGHYWHGYTAETSPKNPQPSTLAQYVRAAQSLVADGRVLSSGVEKIAGGILELARRIGDLGDLKRKARTHRTLLSGLAKDRADLFAYRDVLKLFLVDKAILSKATWPSYLDRLRKISDALCEGNTDASKSGGFMSWPQNDGALATADGATKTEAAVNTYRVTDGNHSVDIRLGTVHSVKGQSHVATLLLSTNWYKAHSSKRMMPWLLGKKVNGTGAKKQDTQRLLNSYVAMTRPSHLLCIAVPRLALGGDTMIDGNIEMLRSRGWRVAEIVSGTARWRD